MKIGNLYEKKTRDVFLGETSQDKPGGTIKDIKANASGRIFLEYMLKIRLKFKGTHAAETPTFPDLTGVLEQCVDVMSFKKDSKDMFDISAINARTLDAIIKGSAAHSGSVIGAAALADGLRVTADNWKLLKPLTGEFCTAEEVITINRAHPWAPFQEAVRTADDLREYDFLVAKFIPKSADQFLADGSAASVISDYELKIELYGKELYDVAADDMPQLFNLKYKEGNQLITAASSPFTYDLERVGKHVGWIARTYSGGAGLPISDSVVGKIQRKKNGSADPSTDSNFLQLQDVLMENAEMSDKYDANGLRFMRGVTGAILASDSVMQFEDNSILSMQIGGKNVPCKTHELIFTSTSTVTLTKNANIKICELILEAP